MRRLDKLLLKSFWGPFLVTFAIAMFVLLMQILWVYLEDIAGKGLSFFLVIELLAYKCVGLIPMALPLALLISSVMVLGGMAEHYELSSFKSAGVSLLRLMRPLIVISVLCAGLSYACSDYIIPAANMQFGSRMFDIQSKKATLNLEPGVFNDDFNNFAIRIGGKSGDGRRIQDVLIYDHTRAATNQLGQITAKHGELFNSPDGDFLIMRLYDGYQYTPQRPSARNSRATAPFTRTHFDTYTKLFDLTEFHLRRHDSQLFKNNRSMLTTWELQIGADSITKDFLERKQTVSNHLLSYVPMIREDTIQHRRNNSISEMPELDTVIATGDPASTIDMVRAATRDDAPVAESTAPRTEKKARVIAARARRKQEALANPLVTATQNWEGLPALVRLAESDDRERSFKRALGGSRSIMQQAKNTTRLFPGMGENRAKYYYDLHMKFSMAVVCIIFIFIGAPMGAIVRKGGFGYPILVSIIFFVIFVILTIFCRKLAESFVVSGSVAGWLPCVILFPVSIWITIRARNDAKLVDTDGFGEAIRKLTGKLLSSRGRAQVTPLDQ